MPDIKKFELDALRDVVKMLGEKHKALLIPLLRKLEDIAEDKLRDVLDIPDDVYPEDSTSSESLSVETPTEVKKTSKRGKK